MRDEDFATEQESAEEEYSMDDEEFEELDPEMQGFVTGWKRAGRYDKKEEIMDELEEEY